MASATQQSGPRPLSRQPSVNAAAFAAAQQLAQHNHAASTGGAAGGGGPGGSGSLRPILLHGSMLQRDSASALPHLLQQAYHTTTPSPPSSSQQLSSPTPLVVQQQPPVDGPQTRKETSERTTPQDGGGGAAAAAFVAAATAAAERSSHHPHPHVQLQLPPALHTQHHHASLGGMLSGARSQPGSPGRRRRGSGSGPLPDAADGGIGWHAVASSILAPPLPPVSALARLLCSRVVCGSGCMCAAGASSRSNRCVPLWASPPPQVPLVSKLTKTYLSDVQVAGEGQCSVVCGLGGGASCSVHSAPYSSLYSASGGTRQANATHHTCA